MKHGVDPTAITFTRWCPAHYCPFTCLISCREVAAVLEASCDRDPPRSQADWIWFSLGLHVFGVTSFFHLPRFSGHNFPLRRPPYWWLGFLRRSRVKPGGRLSVRSPLQRPVWVTHSVWAFCLLLGRKNALLLSPRSQKQKEEDAKQTSALHWRACAGQERSHTTLRDRWSLKQRTLTLAVWTALKTSIGDNYFKWS